MAYLLVLRTDGIGSQQLGRRATIFFTILAAHIFLIALLVLTKQVAQPKKLAGMSVFSLSAAPNPPSIPMPSPIISNESKPIALDPAQAFADQQNAEGDPDGEVCSPIKSVTTQLTTDPIVSIAISRVPRTERSISEAIVIWNAEWSDTAAEDDSPLAEVRNRIQLILQELPSDCLEMPVVGPRLIPIANEGSTTFLAVGSGEWSWQQLIDKPDSSSFSPDEWTWEQLIGLNTKSVGKPADQGHH